MRSGVSNFFMGNTALMSSLSCDSVIESNLGRQPALLPALNVILAKPLLWNKQSAIQEPVPVA
jgi:hypothetical protein